MGYSKSRHDHTQNLDWKNGKVVGGRDANEVLALYT